ncbi:hypothetical protein OG21DRAFT_1495315 [Imleria badia]|nr:hypothetical protein OG21DRAFT_1495315 [Imleria badia]
MDPIPLDSIISEFRLRPEAQTDLLSSPDEPSEQWVPDPDELFRMMGGFIGFLSLQNVASRIKALAWRFIQLVCKPKHLASLILDLWSLSLSIIWTTRPSGPDLLYPLSNLKKHRSGRLARLLLEHSRDHQLRYFRFAASRRDGVDPPRVAVIDLDEVAPEIIERGYTISADFFGVIVLVTFFQILLIPILLIFLPVDFSPIYEWLCGWATYLFGEWLGAWFAFLAGLALPGTTSQWLLATFLTFWLCCYAVFRGESTLSLVRRSDISTPGCAVLLDRDFTVIIIGIQYVVEAIAESSFTMSHTIPRRYLVMGWLLGQDVCYEILKALCEGLPFAILAVFWFLLKPISLLTVCVPLVPIVVVSFARVGIAVTPALIRMICALHGGA